MTAAQAVQTDIEDDGRIVCHIDGARVHSVKKYIRENYADTWTIEKYREEYPDAPTLSEAGKKVLKRQKAQTAAKKEREAAAQKEQELKMHLVSSAASGSRDVETRTKDTQQFGKTFDLGNSKAALNARGNPIPVTVINKMGPESRILVPDVDPNYVFNIELTKSVLMGIELNLPTYLWGYHGTGKTTCFEQFAARTNRPFLRVQHTVNTEEAHIVGQYIVKDGSTEFQLGPLAEAMLFGYIYCADEYDFAMPSVLSVYQPVLEGKPLVIKDAPPELRVIRPHEDFRFVATGNTNGGGDETGLYQGTNIQNAANYSRFAIVDEVKYMEKKLEISVIASQAKIDKEDAKKLVEFATEVREQFAKSAISSTISPRELIRAATIAIARGSDWKKGLMLGFGNRLSRVDQEVIVNYLQRTFG
ncbi:MAG: AAA family ATPase [Roseibium sp.]|nr:AAA family ATPase [Roseibium sp.]